VGDLDNDGLTDVLILAQNGPLAFFHNLGPGGHFLTLRLEGRAANRDGVGACVRVSASGRTQVAWRLGGGSFLSASDDRLHFGLGATSRIEAAEDPVGDHLQVMNSSRSSFGNHDRSGIVQGRRFPGG